MSDDECRNDCTALKSFPKRPENRPGLSHIDYRIGTYADIREALLRQLNLDPVLINWTHREADDPGIALLEGASILGDILTFYQELYANEAYLRTAEWRESIGDLVRLLGYRLSPGVGGKATFAFEVKGDKPVVIPKGFPIKAQVEGSEVQVDFQGAAEIVAYPGLSKFNLYRPRAEGQRIAKGSNRLEVESVVSEDDEVKTDIASKLALKLMAGDRIILIPSGEILIVSEVRRVLDRIIIEFEGSLRKEHYGFAVEAHRIGRTFRHFGYNAPALTTRLLGSGRRISQNDTDFNRSLSAGYEGYCNLSPSEMPLDAIVDDLATGNAIVCQFFLPYTMTAVDVDGSEHVIPGEDSLTELRRIVDIRSDALCWGNLSGSSSVITLDEPLVRLPERANIRKMSFHEVKGPEMILRAGTEWESESAIGNTLNYWGTYDQALKLQGRSLILQKEGAESQQISVTNSMRIFEEALKDKDTINPWLWPVYLDRPLEGFSLSDFNEEDPRAIVYGNLVQATQGKTEKQAVLGSGDSREMFQTFKLPKSPLTYFRSGEQTPPEVPELEVFVSGRLWTRVPFFFGHGPKEEIYIIREDSEGNSWVQFGDGKAGSRLPSGFQNVVAGYRTGTGAFGPLKEGTTVQAGARLNHLQKIHLPGIVTGGDLPESGEKARQAAPGKVQSLGRLVSLQDFEAEALSIAGVAKAKARWALNNNVPAVVITVLMESGREKEYEEARGILIQADQDRGAKRFAIIVAPGHRQLVKLDLEVGYDPSYQWQLLQKSIKEALGVSGGEDEGIDGSHGLFASQNRRFGQLEHATRIKGAVQNIKGVVWVKVSIFRLKLGIIYHTDKVECHEHSLLCLNASDCHLHPVSVSPTEVPLND
ncbi:MAG: hypothetical protein A4E49_02506 [Methanosaeta sp. PtaU1.Bin112]|nr:MAG: hypothetical protein A4E49_02506 [Methanosaeta sp. PtaU1.Bin112]